MRARSPHFFGWIRRGCPDGGKQGFHSQAACPIYCPTTRATFSLILHTHPGVVAVDPYNTVACPHREELAVTGKGAAEHLRSERRNGFASAAGMAEAVVVVYVAVVPRQGRKRQSSPCPRRLFVFPLLLFFCGPLGGRAADLHVGWDCLSVQDLHEPARSLARRGRAWCRGEVGTIFISVKRTPVTRWREPRERCSGETITWYVRMNGPSLTKPSLERNKDVIKWR